MKKGIVISSAFIALFLCSCNKSKTDIAQSSNLQEEKQDTSSVEHAQASKDKEGKATGANDSTKASEGKITAKIAYEGVNNYCHKTYDWSIAEENPTIMYLTMGEETEEEYQVIFRSYTGSFVYFYVDKATGKTSMIEYVPTLDVKEESGSFDLFEYVKPRN